MQVNTYSKYALRDLHEAIDLFDRKITYCQTYERFGSPEEREKALQKLSVKRGALVKTALALRADGVESDNSFLPRSFRTAAAEAADPSEQNKAVGNAAPRRTGIVLKEPRQAAKSTRSPKKTTGRAKSEIHAAGKA